MLTTIQRTRIATTIRSLRQTPEWQDLKRFLVAATASDNPGEIHEVSEELVQTLKDAMLDEANIAIEVRQR